MINDGEEEEERTFVFVGEEERLKDEDRNNRLDFPSSRPCFKKYQECLSVAIWSCWDRFGAYISWGKVLVNTHFVFIFTEFLIFEYLRS